MLPRPLHRWGKVKYKRVVSHLVVFSVGADLQRGLLKQTKSDPQNFRVETENPCDQCIGAWPCIIYNSAAAFKCKTCAGLGCSFYDPDQDKVKIEPNTESTTAHETTKASTAKSKASSSKHPRSDANSDLDQVRPKKKPKPRSTTPSTSKNVEMEASESSEDCMRPSEKFYHNSRKTRKLVRKLEAQGWYKKMEGDGHSLKVLLMMGQLHVNFINGGYSAKPEEVKPVE
jgi:hypothetical protein